MSKYGSSKKQFSKGDLLTKDFMRYTFSYLGFPYSQASRFSGDEHLTGRKDNQIYDIDWRS